MVPRLVATSATIIPCGGNASSKPLSIPVKSNQTADEGMSLIVQLGTTNVGYTPTLTTAVVSSGTANRSVNFRPQQVTTNQQPTSVAKHRLPMQINRQPPQVNRTLLGQQHAALPVRNIAALARPISQPLASASSGKPVPQHSAPSPTVAGRVLASPVKDSTLDDDLLEGVVEKRPKYHKHLPLSYQYVLQDHNYGAPPPPTPSTPPKPLVNGVSTANGLTRSQPPTSQQVPNIASNSFNVNRSKSVQQPSTTTAFGNATMTNVFGIGTRGAAPPAEESDVESTDGEREVDPQGEETETAPEEGEEDIEEDSVTRCICEMQHDDGYMICCDKCFVWQHVACMGLDRKNIPDTYMCEKCQPRRVDKQKAIALQLRKKREQLLDTSDSSSDTSSGSNAAKIPLGKPNVPVNNRRRSEPTQRKNSASNAKQRRESSKEHGAPRQNKQATNKKKQAEKRPPARRKSSQPGINNNPLVPEKSSPVEKKVTTPTTPVEQLRQWIDSYEEAVTNHYSPELRARVASIKVNGIHSDLKLPTNLMTTPKCRVSLLPSGIKILVACVSISGNQPLLELRGKYMLCGSGPANRPPRIATPLPGPYIFHYKLPRDNTEVCVDARTYGNDARFVRRSCKPNSEMRHCIEKGALHLYLVTTKAIDKNTEITLAMAPGLTCVICGDSCTSATPLSPSDTHKSLNGLISPTNNNNTQITDKRRRGRRRTMSENLSPPKAAAKVTPKPPPKSQALSKVSSTPKPTSKIVPSVRVPTPPPRVPTPPPEPVIEKARTPSPPPPPTPPPPSPPARSPSPPSPPPPAPTTRSAASIAARKPPTSPKKESPPENITSTRQQKREAADKKKKMTREERKMEAIMKAFERMEKDQARKQEAQARQTQRKDSTETDSKDKIEPKEKEKEKDRGSEKEEPLTNNNRSSQRKRKFSTTKRKSRGRSQSTPQPTLRPRRTLRRSQPTRDRSPDSAESSDESPIRQRLRTPAPSTPLKTPPVTPTKQDTPGRNDFSKQNFESPPHNQVNSSPSSGETPPTPMSKTAMLIAAAVGPLAPGFKFPMTKKGLINSWLKSPESSPPALPEELPPRGQGFNATKKRWLRQAISEECDSPNGRPEASNSPSEHVAPPKKRRLARESVSEDHSTFTPPSTPTHTAEALNQCGSSQDSEGPESPAAAAASVKPKVEIKNEEEATEESEDDVPLKQVSVKEEEKKDGIGSGKTVTIKEDLDTKEGVSFKEEKESNAEKKESKKPGAAASASATKRKLSISEYRQRKQQGPGTVGQKSPGKPDRPNSPTTSATSSMSSSSSEDEDETPNNVIAKSLMLEAALDSTLSKKPPLFDSAPTLVERQRENLTQRLKREFGLFLSDDEESDKTRKQGNGDVLNREKEKDLGKKKNLLPPPPPPVEPPQYPTAYFPGVGHPMYSNRFASVPPPATLVDSQYYSNNSSAYYSQLPH